MPEAVYRLVGKAHSIIATDHNGRSLRILDKHGQLKLVHLPPSSMTLMHGRLVHAGWGVPSCHDDLVPHAMLFAYVLMGPPVDASDDDIHTALQTLPQLMSPPWDRSSLKGIKGQRQIAGQRYKTVKDIKGQKYKTVKRVKDIKGNRIKAAHVVLQLTSITQLFWHESNADE
jgi:hypothetical protein